MLVAQRIENLLNGVSEQPPELRHPSQAEEQINALSSTARGLTKRPPSVHVGKLSDTPDGWEDAFVHSVYRDDTERYRITIAGGGVRVFDALTNQEYPVYITPGSDDYLLGSEGFRALTVGDTTIIVNRGRTVRTLPQTAPEARHEALLYVRQADFSTGYTVTLDGVEVSHVTPDGTNAQARQQISTDFIAGEIHRKLVEHKQLSSVFNFTLVGSTIHIARKDGGDFTLRAQDGLADRGIRVVKGSVQDFDDLPYRAVDGFVVEITGHAGSDKDNYWVVYDAAETPEDAGVWRETVKPGTPISMDPATLPHLITRNGNYLRGLRVVGEPTVPVVVPGEFEVRPFGWGETVDPNDIPPPADATEPWIPWPPWPFPNKGTKEAGTMGLMSVSTTEGEGDLGRYDQLVRDHGEALKRTLQALPATEGPRRVDVRYDIDTSSMGAGEQVSVSLYIKPAGATEHQLIAQKHYTAGKSIAGDSITAEGAFNAGDTLYLRLDYGTGETPDSSRRARLIGRGVNRPDAPGIQVATLASRRIDFAGAKYLRHPLGWGPLRVLTLKGLGQYSYPAGIDVTVTVDGESFVYNTGAADRTHEEVALGVVAAITAGSSYVARHLGDGVVDISNPEAGSAAPELSVTTSFDPARMVWVPGANLEPGSLVGMEAVNETSTQRRVVTGNSRSTLTVAEGEGQFGRRGDVVSVKPTEETFFVLSASPWSVRTVGDLNSSPWPSFVGHRISDVFFTQNRLGFVSGENVVLSRAGDLFNFFRETSLDVLPGDYIDVQSAHPLISNFHTALQWNGEMYLFSDTGQFVLSGEPVLTPQTVRLDLISRFPNSPRVRPFASGSVVFMARQHGGRTQVLEYTVPTREWESPGAWDTTGFVPTYLDGEPLAITGDPALGFLAVLCGGQRNVLYVYIHASREDGTRLQASWSKWVFPAGTEIIHLDMMDGILGMVCRRPDGVYLETVDLSTTLNYSA